MVINNSKRFKKKEFKLIEVGEVFSNNNYYFMKIDEVDGWNAINLEDGDLYSFNYNDKFYLENVELTIK